MRRTGHVSCDRSGTAPPEAATAAAAAAAALASTAARSAAAVAASAARRRRSASCRCSISASFLAEADTLLLPPPPACGSRGAPLPTAGRGGSPGRAATVGAATAGAAFGAALKCRDTAGEPLRTLRCGENRVDAAGDGVRCARSGGAGPGGGPPARTRGDCAGATAAGTPSS